MMDAVLDEFRRQQERIDEILGPSRRMYEECLRPLASIGLLEDQFKEIAGRATLDGPVHVQEVLRSMAKIGQADLADYSSIIALTTTAREFSAVTEAVRQQSRWIEEVSGLSVLKNLSSFSDPTSLAALEKLAASRDALLDASRWMVPRSFSSVLTDILHAGRSEWALTQLHDPKDRASIVLLARASGEVAERVATFRNDSEVSFEPEAFGREASAVARVLAEEALIPPLPERQLLDREDRAEAFRHLETIADVLRILETRAGRPLFGGFGAWLMGAGLAVANPGRVAEDRFDAATKLLHDAFVAGLGRADAALSASAPVFFLQTVRGLRDTSAAHAPEASRPHAKIVKNLRERERHLRALGGKVPVTEGEWLATLGVLLRMAAAAAIEFRDSLE